MADVISKYNNKNFPICQGLDQDRCLQVYANKILITREEIREKKLVRKFLVQKKILKIFSNLDRNLSLKGNKSNQQNKTRPISIINATTPSREK